MSLERNENGITIPASTPIADADYIARVAADLPDSRRVLMAITMQAFQDMIDGCGFRFGIETLAITASSDAATLDIVTIRKIMLLESVGAITPRNDADGYTVDGWEIAEQYIGAFVECVRENRKERDTQWGRIKPK